ncbi:porin family protein [Fluviicola taffensis]|uniref:porin family protein n=1 Tax=Fluviicola taffensis TaxID=191579 RepID=UPI0031384700
MKPPLKVLIPLFVLVLHFSYAQSNRYDWGIEGGPNLSTFKDQPGFDARTKVFFSGGVSFQYNSKKIFSFRTGLYYQKKGYQQEVKDKGFSTGIVNASTEMTSNYHYLTLPLLARATFGKKVKFFMNAGPYVSYLMVQRFTSELSKVPVNAENNKNFNAIKDWDLGITGGVGIAIPLKSWMISLEVRNYFGILNTHIRTNDGYGNSSGKEIEQYTNTTDLNIGVAYRLGFRDSN